MKRTIIISLALLVWCSMLTAQTTRKAKSKHSKVVQGPTEVALAPRSNDCFFAMNLMLDSSFGPTEPLQGFGYINEIHCDAQTKNVFDAEHNSVWYKIDCPYAGKLIIDITPKSENDDYNFLVYKYTDKYFCNRVEKNRVKPIRSVMSIPDANLKGRTGLGLKGTLANISPSSNVAYARYIDVQAGESYIVVVDNLQDGGLGHTIRAEIYTEHAPLYIQVVDSLEKQRTTANIRVKESDNDAEIANLVDAGNAKLKLLPNKEYDIYITKSGYFNYYRHVDYAHVASSKDSVLTARLAQIKVGSKMAVNGDLYFDVLDNDSVVLMKESYSAMDEVVKTLTEYPKIKIMIIGRMNTDGLNLRKDNEESKKRADALKAYMVSKGISESSITTRGSTIKELNRQLADQNKRNVTISPRCEIMIQGVE